MPRYYFNVRDGDTIYPDYEGTEVADLEAARREAHKDIVYIYNEMLLKGPLAEQRIDIVDSDGKTLATVAFTEVLRPH